MLAGGKAPRQVILQTLLRANGLPTLGAVRVNLTFLASVHTHLLANLVPVFGLQGAGFPGNHLRGDGVLHVVSISNGRCVFSDTRLAAPTPVLHATYTHPSILFRPHQIALLQRYLVEAAGTAPASESDLLQRFNE